MKMAKRCNALMGRLMKEKDMVFKDGDMLTLAHEVGRISEKDNLEKYIHNLRVAEMALRKLNTKANWHPKFLAIKGGK